MCLDLNVTRTWKSFCYTKNSGYKDIWRMCSVLPIPRAGKVLESEKVQIVGWACLDHRVGLWSHVCLLQIRQRSRGVRNCGSGGWIWPRDPFVSHRGRTLSGEESSFCHWGWGLVNLPRGWSGDISALQGTLTILQNNSSCITTSYKHQWVYPSF